MSGSALVLGGGGVAGIAWELGLLTGLADAGVDLCDADLVVGTSAGSVVGAMVATGCDLQELYERQLTDAGGERAARMSPGATLRWSLAAATSRNQRRFRARVGALARTTRTASAAERKRIIAARLPVHEWPSRRLVVTAVDASNGDFRRFDRESGVPLVDAVTASCAMPGIWPPVTIDGRPYMDGGIRSSANVDVAAGAERIVVIVPLPGGNGPLPGVRAQVARLGDSARVAVVSPNLASRNAFGQNILDATRLAPAAKAGRDQASTAALAIRSVWAD
jgi:NTE family protein